MYNNLHLICKYEDDKDYVTLTLSFADYANAMQDVLFSLLQTGSDEADITQFIICTVFSKTLPNTDTECPSYSELIENEDEDEDEYIAIGTVDIFAEENLNTYKQWIINELTSKNFAILFENQMNQRLDNLTKSGQLRRRRRLLETYESFKVIELSVVDGNNATDEDSDNEQLTGQEADSTVIVVVSVVGVVLLLLVIGGLVYLYCRTKNVTKENDDAYRVQMASTSNVNGIERAEQGGEQEEAMEMEGSPAPGAQHQMQNIETEGQSMPRENPDADAEDEDDDILKQVNQTFGSDFEHDDDADIVERVNSLTAGKSEDDMDVVRDVNETIGGMQD